MRCRTWKTPEWLKRRLARMADAYHYILGLKRPERPVLVGTLFTRKWHSVENYQRRLSEKAAKSSAAS